MSSGAVDLGQTFGLVGVDYKLKLNDWPIALVQVLYFYNPGAVHLPLQALSLHLYLQIR